MMKKISLAIVLLAFIVPIFGQTNCKIKKASAYYTSSAPGMQMVDDNGYPVPPKMTIDRFIYIELTSRKKPEIVTVLYNTTVLSVTLTAVEGNKAVLGSNFANNPDFNVQAKKCNSLWKLDLYTVDGKDMPELDCKDISINIKNEDGTTCTFKISNESRLNLLPRY
ncbi:MAG: hypothetical protein IPL84_13905 [Chitinophagaceae bacterium]|nr:hypothetical protein [Chitinophagaceae bacterium]